jgi:hypothetical protein
LKVPKLHKISPVRSYDMCKAIDKGMVISDLRLVSVPQQQVVEIAKAVTLSLIQTASTLFFADERARASSTLKFFNPSSGGRGTGSPFSIASEKASTISR